MLCVQRVESEIQDLDFFVSETLDNTIMNPYHVVPLHHFASMPKNLLTLCEWRFSVWHMFAATLDLQC